MTAGSRPSLKFGTHSMIRSIADRRLRSKEVQSAEFRVQGASAEDRHAALCTLHLSYEEPLSQLILRVDPMLGPAHQVRPALHFRDHRGVRATGGAADHPAGEPAADDALDDDWLSDPDLPPSEMDGEAPAHAGSGR